MARLAGWAVAALVALSLFLVPSTRAQEPKKRGEFDDVRVRGSQAFAEKELLAAGSLRRPSKLQLFRKRYTIKREDVEDGAAEIQLFYQRNGYYEATATLAEGGGGTAEIQVAEGPPSRVARVTVVLEPPDAQTGGVSVEGLLASLALKAGDIFTVHAYEHAQKAVERAFKDNGFPFAQVKAEASVDLAAHAVTVQITATPKLQAVFGPVLVQGVQHTEEVIIRRALLFTEGEPYDQRLVERSQDALLAMGLFESVAVFPKRKSEPGTATMVVRVREGRHHRARVGLGYGTYEEMRWQLNWETLRLNDHILTLGTSVKSSKIETNANGYLKRPYFLSRANTLLSDVTYGKNVYPEFSFHSLWGRFGVERAFTDRITGRVFAKGERVTEVSPEAPLAKAVPPSAVSPANFASFEASVTWRTTDDLLAPTKGFLLNLAAEPAEDVTNQVRFTRALADGRAYFDLTHEMVLALKLRIGAILTSVKSSKINVTRRFYAGGQGSVRGYGWNILGPCSEKGVLLGGDGLLEASAELRFPLKGDLKGLVFVDAGSAFREPWHYPVSNLYYGAGFGLRYKTPVGPVGVDVAFKLKDYPLENSPYQFYFFIGYAF